jgi:putative phosphoribosyl transferase
VRSTDLKPRFVDRIEAGRELAAVLGKYAGREDVIALGLPRGGVPVAFEVARELGAPLDVFVVRKLGLPMEPELAMGAIASGGKHFPQASDGEIRDLLERAAQQTRSGT